jgi:hypothetical protein
MRVDCGSELHPEPVNAGVQPRPEGVDLVANVEEGSHQGRGQHAERRPRQRHELTL